MSQELASSRNEAAPLRSFKYRTGAGALKCLADGQVYFALPGQLNDTLESKFEFSGASDAWEAVKATVNELAVTKPDERVDLSMPVPRDFMAAHEAENEKFYEVCQRVGVYSTASRPDNQPMWAYYCDNSAGICLELEWSADVIAKENLQAVDVTYTGQSRRGGPGKSDRVIS